MLDYDKEADRYDATRGGEPRAAAAAAAVLALVPLGARGLLDMACGTGTVTSRLTAGRPGLRVTGVDAAHGMTRRAAERVPGAVVRADARRLPFPAHSFDAVSAVWLLHLLDDARPVVAEAARVLRPGGVFVTTVDKAAAHHVGSDIDALTADCRAEHAEDAAERVTRYAAGHGLVPGGTALFRGHGQGSTPRRVAQYIRSGRLYPAGGPRLAERVETLPGPDVPRREPDFTLLAFRRT
ncbi:class I SAM-dependent methyltransferase [Streptomyces triticiradicis]|uniref:Class I SAM-dependent methyltransferase n=1 Tax=Streptomyces triticiradicis TaxID=2651189 RepID=A0A7J5D7A6_9ACTN|nr:class I SAM-dependent methyltransferase [Streptomyces triticiradicis]KAB1981400.1 class I SAM-dependent methyltransferase [Streptomyces triticiradicis]